MAASLLVATGRSAESQAAWVSHHEADPAEALHTNESMLSWFDSESVFGHLIASTSAEPALERPASGKPPKLKICCL